MPHIQLPGLANRFLTVRADYMHADEREATELRDGKYTHKKQN